MVVTVLLSFFIRTALVKGLVLVTELGPLSKRNPNRARALYWWAPHYYNTLFIITRLHNRQATRRLNRMILLVMYRPVIWFAQYIADMLRYKWSSWVKEEDGIATGVSCTITCCTYIRIRTLGAPLGQSSYQVNHYVHVVCVHPFSVLPLFICLWRGVQL